MPALQRKERAVDMGFGAKDVVVLLVCGVAAVVALVMISIAGEVYGLGIALFAVAVVAAFWYLKRMFDRVDAGRH